MKAAIYARYSSENQSEKPAITLLEFPAKELRK